MKKTLIVGALLATIAFGCRLTDAAIHSLLNSSRLSSQLFNIDISKDTFLVTPKGAVIKLPKGTLETTGGNIVQLEIKEAYSMQDIIAAGLTTQSNGQPLSSGGMIYINAVGENKVRIVKAIAVSIPTPFLDPNMQLFKGSINKDSTINWTDPQPLPPNQQQAGLELGKQLFKDNCSQCHGIEKDMTGPALAHIVKRLGNAGEELAIDLYGFTKHNSQAIANNPYFCMLYNSWNKTAMNEFPVLTDQDLDNLYGYIENESDRLRLPVPDNGIVKKLDSCRTYLALAANLERIKRELEQDSNLLTNDVRNQSVSIVEASDTMPIPLPDLNRIQPLNSQSLYYQFTIESFGWYNIDVLTKDIGAVESTLLVRVQAEKKATFNLYLAIPSIKGLFPGGELEGRKDSYGFYAKDGKIPLPQNTQAYLFAMGERDSTILFASKTFTISTQQEFTLQPTAITPEALKQAIEQMGLPDLNMKVERTVTGAKLRALVSRINKVEELKPSYDCKCLAEQMHRDSIRKAKRRSEHISQE